MVTTITCAIWKCQYINLNVWKCAVWELNTNNELSLSVTVSKIVVNWNNVPVKHLKQQEKKNVEKLTSNIYIGENNVLIHSKIKSDPLPVVMAQRLCHLNVFPESLFSRLAWMCLRLQPQNWINSCSHRGPYTYLNKEMTKTHKKKNCLGHHEFKLLKCRIKPKL